MPVVKRRPMPTELPDESLFASALEFCARVRGCTVDEALRRLEEGSREFHSTFRYGLAKGLSSYLGSLGDAFREVYVYGSTMDGGANPASDIDVIVVVGKRRDEVNRLLLLLDVSMTACYRQLLRLKKDPRSLLDVQIVEGHEASERSGRGAVLAGLNTRPICLWRFPPERTSGTPSGGSPRPSTLAVGSSVTPR